MRKRVAGWLGGFGLGVAVLVCLGPGSARAGLIEWPGPVHEGGHEEPGESFNAVFAWPQFGGLGSGFPVDITYSYSNLLDGGIADGSLVPVPAALLRATIEESLRLWASAAPLNFTEVVDSGPLPAAAVGLVDRDYAARGHPMLRFGHHFIDGIGSGKALAHAYFPGRTGLAGDAHFDNSNFWVFAPGSGVHDIRETAVHEIGHTLGLGHESTRVDPSDPDSPFLIESIMNPKYVGRYSGPGTAFLFPDDIAGIQWLYGEGVGSVTPIPEPTAMLIYLIAAGSMIPVRRLKG